MKKAVLLVVAVFFALPMTGLAQSYPVDQGVFIVGGSGSLFTRKLDVGRGEDERITTFSVSPDVQYFVIPNLAAGGLLSFFYRNFDGDTDSALLLGPKLSYYFGGGDRTLYPFVSAQLLFDVENISDTSQLSLEGGGAYMIAKNVALTGALVFSAPTEDIGGNNTIGLNLGVRVFAY